MDVGFIDHLSQNNLSREHSHYLNTLPSFSDSTNYYKTKFNLKYFNDSLFFEHYFKSKTLCDLDHALLVNASSALLTHNDQLKIQAWFGALKQPLIGKDLAELNDIYKCSVDPNSFSAENFPAQAQNSFSKYKKVYNKKPFLAAALSTVIPGLGKLYAGKTRSFFMTLILNTAYAAQTIESANKLGPTHAFTIINAGAFGAFYLSNIYGSYKAIHQLRREYKKQFLIDATRLYN